MSGTRMQTSALAAAPEVATLGVEAPRPPMPEPPLPEPPTPSPDPQPEPSAPEPVPR
jgi:hypothetical protein